MDRKEILRYLRTKSDIEDEKTLALIETAAQKIEDVARPRSLYRIYDCTVTEESVTLGGLTFRSTHLAQHLAGCRRAAVLGATLGTAVDTAIKTAMATDTALAVALNAAASAYIEAYCDATEEAIARDAGASLRPRYSPGYYDLDITEQKRLFLLIDITKRIGVTLSDSCQMIPSKSVTALIGIEDKA